MHEEDSPRDQQAQASYKPAATLYKIPFTERLNLMAIQSREAADRLQDIQELQRLLDKNPDVCKILSLMQDLRFIP